MHVMGTLFYRGHTLLPLLFRDPLHYWALCSEVCPAGGNWAREYLNTPSHIPAFKTASHAPTYNLGYFTNTNDWGVFMPEGATCGVGCDIHDLSSVYCDVRPSVEMGRKG